MEKAVKPRSDIVKHPVDLDERGRIMVDCADCTNVPGLFAAGDVTNSYAEQVLIVIAIGEGAKAALSAYEYLLPGLTIVPVVHSI